MILRLLLPFTSKYLQREKDVVTNFDDLVKRVRLLKWKQCFWVKMLNTLGALPEATSLNVDCMYLPDTGSGVSTPNLISQISFQLSTRIYVLLSAIMKIIILLSFGCVSFSRTGPLC